MSVIRDDHEERLMRIEEALARLKGEESELARLLHAQHESLAMVVKSRAERERRKRKQRGQTKPSKAAPP